jgi:hypothetical protein
VLCTRRCVAGKSWEVMCWWLVSPVQQCCCSHALSVCEFFIKNIFVCHRCSAVSLGLKLAWNGRKFNDISLPEQPQAALAKYKTHNLPVVQSLNVLIQVTIVLL